MATTPPSHPYVSHYHLRWRRVPPQTHGADGGGMVAVVEKMAGMISERAMVSPKAARPPERRERQANGRRHSGQGRSGGQRLRPERPSTTKGAQVPA